MKFLKNLILFSISLCFCDGYKILAVFPLSPRSHYNINSKLVKELAARGHEVTFVTPYSPDPPIPNIKTISLESLIGPISGHSDGYKILALFPLPARSHYNINSKLVKELAAKGHEVTFVTPYPSDPPVPNIKIISVESVTYTMEEEKKHYYNLGTRTILKIAKFLTNISYTITANCLKHENVQKLLHSEEKYDVVLMPHFANEALFPIAHHFKAPLILVATMPLFSWGSFELALPSPSSYVPNLLTPYRGTMNFWQRLANSYYDAVTILHYQWIVLPKHRELVKKYIPGQPELYNFLNNASLVLINSHMSTNELIPQVPNAIEIGGFHIEEPKKLPEDLQKFCDEAVDGFIIFSLGSILKSSDLSQTTRNEILDIFSKLKQKVLWKWETDDIPGKPDNVKLIKWLPQSDLLAHPNVKAFITHGGLLSTMESVYHGVPIVGIPVFTDQKVNVESAISNGYAEVVPFSELNGKNLYSALQKVLTDPKYKENAQKYSNIMKDRPVKPIDDAIYWIEYVIRHRGAPHLRYSGMNLTWYQRNLLDVIAFVAISVFTTIFVFVVILKRISKYFSKKNDKTKKNN